MYLSWKLELIKISELFLFKDGLNSTFDGRFWKAKMCSKLEKYSLASECIVKLACQCQYYVKSNNFFTERIAIRLNKLVSILDSCLGQVVDFQVPSNMKKIKRKMETLVAKYRTHKRSMQYLVTSLCLKLVTQIVEKSTSLNLHPEYHFNVFKALTHNGMFDEALKEHEHMELALKNVKSQSYRDILEYKTHSVSSYDALQCLYRYR